MAGFAIFCEPDCGARGVRDPTNRKIKLTYYLECRTRPAELARNVVAECGQPCPQAHTPHPFADKAVLAEVSERKKPRNISAAWRENSLLRHGADAPEIVRGWVRRVGEHEHTACVSRIGRQRYPVGR